MATTATPSGSGSAIAAADERFVWTTQLIDAVLALRFQDAALADAIASAKGNEAKRRAWTALADKLQQTHGVTVSENKIRRAISKWQSQHRTWVQTMATKSPAELTQTDRAPTYMPVLQRYFQNDVGDAGGGKLAPIEAGTASPEAASMGLEAFESVLFNGIPPLESNTSMQCEGVELEVVEQPLQVSPNRSVPDVAPASMHTARPATASIQTLRPRTSYQHVHTNPALASSRTTSAPPVRLGSANVLVVPEDSDEDPGTSQEESRASFSIPPVKQRKLSHDNQAVLPRHRARAAAVPRDVLPPTSRAVDVVGTSELKELASRVTQQLSWVYQEQMVLQRKQFEEQLALQRKQYEEQFAVQRKQVEVVQAVLESLQGATRI